MTVEGAIAAEKTQFKPHVHSWLDYLSGSGTFCVVCGVDPVWLEEKVEAVEADDDDA